VGDLSLKEAAAVAELPEPAVRRAIERRSLAPRAARAGTARRWRFGVRDLLFARLIAGFPLPLGAEDKRALGELVYRGHAVAGPWRAEGRGFVREADGLALRIDAAEARRRIARNLRDLRRGRRRVVSDPMVLGGEPVFSGTRIPLSHVAGLIRNGASLDEVLADCPALGARDVAYAALCARMTPRPGRPRGTLKLVRIPD